MNTSDLILAPWQQKSWDLLCGYIKQKRFPQALLITGNKGLGKHSLATLFAKSLLCTDCQDNGSSCGNCLSCQLIAAGTHPDFISLSPDEDKTTISVNQIRRVITDTYLKPQYESNRVLIINPADVMTISSANAFLKCLEEPTERTVFILITDKPNKLPATIISRCQKLPLNLPDQQMLHNWLAGQGSQSNRETLLNLVRRCIINTQQVADETLLKQRQDCFNDWLDIARQLSNPVSVTEKWLKLPEFEVLNWLISWITDLILSASHIGHERLCNQDLAKPLQELAQLLDLSHLFGLYDRLLTNRRLLDTQINSQMMMEEFLVQWQELNRRT